MHICLKESSHQTLRDTSKIYNYIHILDNGSSYDMTCNLQLGSGEH